MVKATVIGKGTPDDPWILKTPPGTSEYKLYRDEQPTRRLWSASSGQPG